METEKAASAKALAWDFARLLLGVGISHDQVAGIMIAAGAAVGLEGGKRGDVIEALHGTADDIEARTWA